LEAPPQRRRVGLPFAELTTLPDEPADIAIQRPIGGRTSGHGALPPRVEHLGKRSRARRPRRSAFRGRP